MSPAIEGSIPVSVSLAAILAALPVRAEDFLTNLARLIDLTQRRPIFYGLFDFR